jgi:hypothetical protein
LVARADEAVTSSINVLSEMWLAAEALGQQADDIARAVSDHATKIDQGVESALNFHILRKDLYKAMRADLGEPVSGEVQLRDLDV